MLKLVKRPKSPNWIMRGTVRGKSGNYILDVGLPSA